jgi:NAD(P)-dependent dehydrogenase (short-subunit alcohol dehydrogenase family)
MSNDIFDLTGKLAIVTGGGTGLGRQFAMTLAQRGARVVLCARRVDKLEETAQAIRAAGGEAYCVPMDVTDGASIAVAFKQIAQYGVPHILINNAGSPSGPMLLSLEEELWDQVIDVNLKGAWLVAKAFTQQIADAGNTGGSIVNIASILGSSVQKGTGVYAAAKAGLLHLTRSMALEWARYGIRANAIAPGYYRTDIAADYLDSDAGKALVKRIPQRRLGQLENLDGVILLLASDASSYMTGSVVTVDGGLSLSIV